MSYSALIAIATRVGAPLVEGILARHIGSSNAALARDVVEEIATQSGLTTEEVMSPSPERVETIGTAIGNVEEIAPQLISIYERELAVKAEAFKAEDSEPLWVRAWRPLGMYGLGLFWFWNVIILHIVNAIWKTALPPMDLSVLLQLSALYMSLYMGGHTVKAVMAPREVN